MNHGVYQQGKQWNRVEYGEGCLAVLGPELSRLGVERPFLLSTRSVVGAGLLDEVRAARKAGFAGEFGECRAHVPEMVVEEIAAVVREADADGLVAVGGSSVIDTAKAVTMLLGSGEASFEAVRGADDREGELLPTLAVPTTLSGGEFTGVTATTDGEDVKHLTLDHRAAPRSILLDPRMTRATPAALWRSTGVKSMSDAIEQICFGAGPATDALCAHAIELFMQGLPAGEKDLEARLLCQQATWLALFGLQDANSSVGIGAALRHQVAVTYGAAHGEVTCVLLPHIVRFNARAVPDRAAPVARALDVPDRGEGIETWNAIAGKLHVFIASQGLPTRLSQIVEQGPDLDALARRVLGERAAQANPRLVEDPQEIVALLSGAF